MRAGRPGRSTFNRRARGMHPVRAAHPSAVAVALAVAVLPGLALASSRVSVEDEAGLIAAAALGGAIELASGAYVLSGTLVMGRDFDVRAAEGADVQLLLAAAPLGLRVEGGARVRFQGLMIAYDAEAPGDALHVRDAKLELVDVDLAFALAGPSNDPERPFGVGAGLVLTGSAEARVNGGGIGRHEGYGIELHGAAVLHAEDLIVVRNGAGLHVDADARLTLVGGEVRGHMGSALHVRGRSHAELIGVFVEDNGTAGLGEGFDVDAVRVADEARATFDGVTFAFNPRYALSVHGRARVLSRASVYENATAALIPPPTC